MKRVIVNYLLISLLAVSTLMLSTSPIFAKEYKWKMHTFVPEPTALYQGFMMPFIKEIDKRSKGQIKITPYPVGAIVAPTELLVATAEGVIECAMASPGYDTGTIPESYVPSIQALAWTKPIQLADFWYENEEAWDILDKAYKAKNVMIAALLTPDDPNTFFTMFPVNKVSDFKGKLIRSPGVWASLVGNTGASQVNISLGEIYQALEKGVIDGVFSALSIIGEFRWNEVIKCVVYPPVMPSAVNDVIVNLDAFNSLSPELRKMFVETAREINSTHLIPYTRALAERVTTESKAKGVQFVTLSEAEAKKMHQAALGAWEKGNSINANTAQQMKLMCEYLDSKGIKYPKRK